MSVRKRGEKNEKEKMSSCCLEQATKRWRWHLRNKERGARKVVRVFGEEEERKEEETRTGRAEYISALKMIKQRNEERERERTVRRTIV